MKRLFAVALGILTAIGGFVDIGDLVTNIAEEIIFHRKAEVLKHKKKKPGKKKE